MAELPSWDTALTFLFFLGLVAAAALFGGQWGAGQWYRELDKPSWTPPGWLFGPAWAVLYIMIAAAGFLVWQTLHEKRALLLGLWGAQLGLNALWSYIFFGRKELGLGLLEMMGLWLAIAAFIVFAWPVNPRAATLFMPYRAWSLNAAIWRRNPAQVSTSR